MFKTMVADLFKLYNLMFIAFVWFTINNATSNALLKTASSFNLCLLKDVVKSIAMVVPLNLNLNAHSPKDHLTLFLISFVVLLTWEWISLFKEHLTTSTQVFAFQSQLNFLLLF